jgi:glycine cleavage system H protein
LVHIEELDFPDELFYTDRHLWVHLGNSNLVTLGVDDLGQTLAGKIIFVRTLKKGSQLTLGKVFGTLESLKWVERLKSPVNGILEDTNEKLGTQPDLINNDSYGMGWIVKIKAEEEPREQLANLIHGEEVESWVRQELEKYSEQLKKKRGQRHTHHKESPAS